MGKRVKGWLVPSQLNVPELHRRRRRVGFLKICSKALCLVFTLEFRLDRTKGRKFKDNINRLKPRAQSIQIYC